MTPALLFLERTARERVLAPSEFESRLPAIIAAARKRVDALTPPGEREVVFSQRAASYQADRRALRSSREFRALQPFVTAQQRYEFLAGVYLDAAEAFESPALLAKSSEYLAPALKGAELLYEGQRVAMRAGSSVGEEAGLATIGINTIRALEMRHAVTRARLTRTAADIAAAADIIRANGDPVMRDAAEAIDSGERDYCRADGITEALRAACGSENSLDRRLRAFWLNAALLELLAGGKASVAPRIAASDSFEVGLKVLEATESEWEPDQMRYTPEIGERVALYLAKADRLIADARTSGEADQPESDKVDEALALLLKAERLVPYALNPNRFAAIARRFVEITEGLPGDRVSPEIARYAAYFRGLLATRESPR